MFGRIKRYQNYRKTVSELSKMSDRDLNDIGITRCDIRDIARDHNKR